MIINVCTLEYCYISFLSEARQETDIFAYPTNSVMIILRGKQQPTSNIDTNYTLEASLPKWQIANDRCLNSSLAI